ncbi:protein SLOW GREEN 1, chloroplastic [Andrographis paniculata]|uniref:protein SLOW GREEN 1, chloroplastic n=1 Tax=Andrographis paniculata TaxID=175694 RepID=UPI0021E77006|nr:protein SLOW GREEN 1, chloroplastic [Andrographis paniculata]
MNSALTISTPPAAPAASLRSSSAERVQWLPQLMSSRGTSRRIFAIKAESSSTPNPYNSPKETVSPLKSAACAVIFAAAAFGRFQTFPARGEVATPTETLTEGSFSEEVQKSEETAPQVSPLTQLLESNPSAVEALKNLLQEKLDAGEDEESLSILRKLSAAEPDCTEWKFLTARVLNELGKLEEARNEFEEILSKHPFSFDALFETALLMDRSGESAAVISRLEAALRAAESEGKSKEARDVKLIMAQMLFLHKQIDEALSSYEKLIEEDPSDFRPYFCKGMIYSLMDKNQEARAMFAKFRELSPKKFEVEGSLMTPLSRMKLFGTEDEN